MPILIKSQNYVYGFLFNDSTSKIITNSIADLTADFLANELGITIVTLYVIRDLW